MRANLVSRQPRVPAWCPLRTQRFLPVQISGAATAMWNGFRRVDAA
jgi:hypothetical protein